MLLVVRRYGIARITSSVAVATILIGWAVAQYPYLLLPYLTIEEAAGSRATLVAMTVVLVLGSLVLVPALVYMFVLFSRPPRPDAAEPEPTGGPDRDRAGRRSAEAREACGRAPRDRCGEISPHRWIGAVEGFRHAARRVTLDPSPIRSSAPAHTSRRGRFRPAVRTRPPSLYR